MARRIRIGSRHGAGPAGPDTCRRTPSRRHGHFSVPLRGPLARPVGRDHLVGASLIRAMAGLAQQRSGGVAGSLSPPKPESGDIPPHVWSLQLGVTLKDEQIEDF